MTLLDHFTNCENKATRTRLWILVTITSLLLGHKGREHWMQQGLTYPPCCFGSSVRNCSIRVGDCINKTEQVLHKMIESKTPRSPLSNSLSPSLSLQYSSHESLQHCNKDTTNVWSPGSLTVMPQRLDHKHWRKNLNLEIGIRQLTVQLQFSLSTSELGAAWRCGKLRSWLL